MKADELIEDLDSRIARRKKMTSRLYQTILAGRASKTLLQNFVIHRYPIKTLWTRNILGIASRVDDYELRRQLVENIYEEETGGISGSHRHLDTFIRFGECLGVGREVIENAPVLPETEAVMKHNLLACNSDIHFTAGVASVLLLMEGQPPIVARSGESMEEVMRDIYRLPPSGYEFFTHHASSRESDQGASELEDEHAEAARAILRQYCTSEELQAQALDFLDRALEARHRHFDAILDLYYNEQDSSFVYSTGA
jgi:pyrroloquinoline-quinone synthase